MNGKNVWWKGSRGEWYVVVQVLLFALVVFGPARLPGAPAWTGFASVAGWVAGGLLGAAGGLMALAGLLYLGRNLSVFPHPLDDASLVQSGPYALVRHPIYSGLILAAFGWSGIVQGTLTFVYALLLFVFFDLKTRREERFLARKFPEYDAYRARVRKLIPFVY